MRLCWLASVGALMVACGPKADPAPPAKGEPAAAEAGPKAEPTAPPPRPTGALVVLPDAAEAVLTAQGPDGAAHRAKGPLVLCDAAAGAWVIERRVAGWEPFRADAEVTAGQTRIVEAASRRAAALHLEGPRHLKVLVTGADDFREEATLPWVGWLPFGDYDLAAFHGRKHPWRVSVALNETQPELHVRVPAPNALGAGGLRVLDTSWALPGDQAVRASEAPSAAAEPRSFGGGPVEDLAQLRWKLRMVVLHRGAGTLRAEEARLKEAGERRHLWVGRDGAVRQLLDLSLRAPASRRVDDVAVHVALAGPSPFTDAQYAALGRLLEGLEGLFPRFQRRFVTDELGRLRAEVLAQGRIFRGVLVRSQLPDPPSGAAFELAWRRLVPDAKPEVRAPPLPGPGWLLARGPAAARVALTSPSGGTFEGRGALLVCRPEAGDWRLAASAEGRRAEARQLKVEADARRVVALEMPEVGDLSVSAVGGAMQARLLGPGGEIREVELPWEGEGLAAGTWRVEVAREGRAPYRIAEAVRPGAVARVEIPDLAREDGIVIAGERYPLEYGVELVGFDDPRGLSFYAAQERQPPGQKVFEPRMTLAGQVVEGLEDLGEQIRMVVLHADVTSRMDKSFQVLSARGLSTHFGITWDGRIFQMLDVAHVAYAAREVNHFAVQIDLNNRLPNLVTRPGTLPTLPSDPRYRERKRNPRPVSERVMINGRDVQSYGYRPAQYRALRALLRVIAGVLPRVSLAYPVADGRVAMDYHPSFEDFEGIAAHWHLTLLRWDPGPGFDWGVVDGSSRHFQQDFEGRAGRRQ